MLNWNNIRNKKKQTENVSDFFFTARGGTGRRVYPVTDWEQLTEMDEDSRDRRDRHRPTGETNPLYYTDKSQPVCLPVKSNYGEPYPNRPVSCIVVLFFIKINLDLILEIRWRNNYGVDSSLARLNW